MQRDAPHLLAEAGLARIHLQRKEFAQAYGIEGEPNPLQRSVMDELRQADGEGRRGGILLVTAALGDGKSETALEVERILSEAFGTQGYAFLLPTMATSDQMHGRVAQALLRQSGEVPGLTLVHSMAWLNSAYADEDLGGALTFSWPDEEWDYEEAPEGREAWEASRWEKFGAMLTAAGFPVPATVRDLSELYLIWELVSLEETPNGTRWSMPPVLPLPGDLLPLDAELTKRLDRIRWTMRTGLLVDGLIKHLVDDLGEPQEILTSLDRLAVATGRDADDVRLAVVELVEAGDARVQRGQEQVDAARLEAHQRFRLNMDWDYFNETRMHLSIGADDA